MKKLILFLCIFLCCTLVFLQPKNNNTQEQGKAVSVRVFDGDEFVDDLQIKDFEIYEDGVKQNIEALYLAKNNQIIRKQESKEFAPQVSRTFYILFQITDYDPRISDAINYLFNEIILPGDSLELMTPVKTYSLSQKALQNMSSEQISKEMIKIIRKDSKVGSSHYRTLLSELRRIVRAISGSNSMTGFGESGSTEFSSVEFLLPRYRETLDQLEKLRIIDEKTFINFADHLSRKLGRKYMFLFYQREYRPELHPRIINQLISAYQDRPNILGDIQDLMHAYKRDPQMNAELLSQAFSDAGIYLNFLFMDKKIDHITGIRMHEQSEDIFETFSKMAKSTGGTVGNSQNPLFILKKGYEKARNYYLLYYIPKTSSPKGDFKDIDIKLINKDYKLSHKIGYFSRQP